MSRLAGKVALISGTARGQGRAAALRFAAEGALVVGGDLLVDEAAETARLAGERMSTVARLDVTDEPSVRALVAHAAERHGRVDVLYNNAGAVRFGPVDEQSFADWRLTLAAELDSVFLACKHAWPHLKAARGAILNIGSTAGMTGSLTNRRVAHTRRRAASSPSRGSSRPRARRTASARTPSARA